MKKHRKVGNSTSTNFYTSQFQLKSTQFPKQSRQRKINTTFSSFKHHLFQQQQKSQQRYRSKDAKPYVEQLKFTTKQDDFRLPQSVTKRSISKTKEQSRLKIEAKNKQLFEQHFQEVPLSKEDGDKKTPLYHFAALKRMKQSNNPLKQKLEKSALQKFKEVVSKENEENQNVVSQKNAESLFQLLKTARMNQFKHQNFKLHSLPEESECGDTQQLIKKDEVFIQKKPNNTRKPSQSNVQQSENEANKNKNIKEVIKSRENLFKNVEQISKPASVVEQPLKPDVPKPNLPHPNNDNAKTEVIKFQKVICDDVKKETFTSSEHEQQSESDFGQQLKEVSKIDFSRKEKNNQQLIQQSTQKISQKSIPIPAFTDTQKTRKQSIKLEPSRNQTMQSDDQKKSTKAKQIQQPGKVQKKQNKYEQSDFDNIPSGQAYDKPATVTGKQTQAEKQRKSSNEFISLNNNKIEKILTPKHLDQPTIKTAPKINPPPKLNSNPDPKPIVRKPVDTHPVDDDQLEQVQFGNQKNTKKPVEPPKQKVQAPSIQPKTQPPKQQQQKNQKNNVPQANKIDTSHQVTQKQQQNDEGSQQSGNQIEDELTYYIDRIQDIGQYRINSKDVYNDRNIEKELIQINKVCAYYMAHQFLYLAQWTCNFFKSDVFLNNFYSLTTDDLKMLKETGVLQQEIQNLSENIEQSKKLLKKCYEQSKPFLKKQQQILIMDGKTSYHIKCCATLIRQFKKVYELLQKNPKNSVMIQRCVYLIELYCTLRLLNGEELKQYEEFEDIQNPIAHIETHKKHLLSL